MTATLQPGSIDGGVVAPAGSNGDGDSVSLDVDRAAVNESRNPGARWHPVTLLVAGAALGAGAIHFAMAPTHMQASTLEGWGFVVTGWIQVMVAAWLVIRPSRTSAFVAGAVSVITVVLWAIARSTGLPFIPVDGHHDTIDVVDGTAVALEGVGFLGALTLLGVVSPRRSSRTVSKAMKGLAGAAAIVPIVAASVALLSPSARGHAHTEASYGPGFELLANGHQHNVVDKPYTIAERAELNRVLAATAPLLAKYPTLADAEAAGYRKAGPFSPGLGQHMNPPELGVGIDSDGVMGPEDIANGMLIYDGIEPDSPLAGFMFLSFAEASSQGFPGTFDHWHSHSDVCLINNPDGTIDSPFGADTGNVPKSLCDSVKGTLMPTTPNMVHVWNLPGYASPIGMFSELNPAITCPGGHFYMVPMMDLARLPSACDDAKFKAEQA